MRVSDLKTVGFAVAILAVVGAGVFAQGAGQAQGQQAQGQGRPGGQGGGAAAQNLQVLPKDTPRQQLTQIMRGFAAALGGVECTHCHVGTMQERAKDDNPKKAIARKMIQMTNAINDEMLKGIGDPVAAGAVAKVTCYTCHRGALKPLNAPPSGGGH
ncbi:MAG TPA: c-type cytochrome [Vicinamibacterales bacterium]|nr:c-type cytochrome [Vicinamibacterales bacterium]